MFGDDFFGLCADQTIDELSVFKDEHGRYARDLETRRSLMIVISPAFSFALFVPFCG